MPGKPITQLAREFNLRPQDIIKLASNENPRGMSPKARAAAEVAMAGVALYPDQFELVAKLAERLGVDSGQIILGSGSNDILDLTARAFLMPGRSAISSQYAFPIYPIATLTAGGENVIAPARDYGHDLAADAGRDSPRYPSGLDCQTPIPPEPSCPMRTFVPFSTRCRPTSW